MAYISGFDRNQSFLFSLNDFISDNNPVRLIDLFVDLLDLPSLGFISHSPSSPGQRPYRSSDLLKLHLYGYVNGIRSSRKLAAESSVDSDPDAIISFNQSISHYKDKLAQFHSLKDSMISNSLSQVSITDPDSRMMSSHGNSDISFNLQTSVDSKNSLIVANDVVSDINDSNQLLNMVSKTIDNLHCVPSASLSYSHRHFLRFFFLFLFSFLSLFYLANLLFVNTF